MKKKTKAPKGAVQANALPKKGSRKKKLSKRSERSIQVTKEHLLAAVEQYLHSMALIDKSEKVISADYPSEAYDWYYFKVDKEVSK